MRQIINLLIIVVLFALSGFNCTYSQERFVEETLQNRKVVLEVFKGCYEPYGSDADYRANLLQETYPGEVIVINMYQRFESNIEDFDLTTDYGDSLATQAWLGFYPFATLNRHVFDGYSNMTINRWEYDSLSKGILGMDAYANIAARATVDWQARQLDVTVQLFYTGDSPESTNYLNVALVQDYIYGKQRNADENPNQVDNGQYVHMHVLRDMLTGQWGEEIITTKAGSFVEKTYSYPIPESVKDIPVELENIRVVAFLSESRTEIITGCEAAMKYTNGGPDYVVHLSHVQQIVENTCDSGVLFSSTVDVSYACNPISSLTFALTSPLGTTEYTQTFEPALQVGSSETFVHDSIDFAINEEFLATLHLLSVNGSENFLETVPDTFSIAKYYIDLPSQEMILTVAQDQCGDEIIWNLVSEQGMTIGEGGPYPYLPDVGTRNRIYTLALPKGCHTFTIYDVGGDGIHNTQGDGFVSFGDIDGNILLTRDGNYGDSAVVMLSYNKSHVPDQSFHVMVEGMPASDGQIYQVAKAVDPTEYLFSVPAYMTLENKTDSDLVVGTRIQPVGEIPDGYILQFNGFGKCFDYTNIPDHTLAPHQIVGMDSVGDALVVQYTVPFEQVLGEPFESFQVQVSFFNRSNQDSLSFFIDFVPVWSNDSTGNLLPIDSVHFPDSVFRGYIAARADIFHDGFLSERERDGLQDVNISDMGIGSLRGIEYFTS